MGILEEICRHSARLPDQAAQEVLDFIALLEARYASQAESRPAGEPSSASSLYDALEKIGFIGCAETDEQLSTTYKSRLDFSNKCGRKS